MTTFEWNSASEWDNAITETGVVHESVANTDYSDASLLKKGYSTEKLPHSASLWCYYPMHEDNASTINDLSGNGRNPAVTGVTGGHSGPLGTTAVQFDGVDDWVELPNTPAPSAYTMNIWAYPYVGPSSTSVGRLVDFRANHVGGINYGSGNGLRFWHRDGGGTNRDLYTKDWSANTWQMFTLTWDGSTVTGYIDGTQINSVAATGTTSQSYDDTFGSFNRGNRHFYEGRLWNIAYWDGYAFSSSEVSEYYDVVAGMSSLTTSKRLS